MLLQIRHPLGAAGRVDLVPQPRHLSEPHLLVVVDLIERPGLHDVVLEQRFEVAVEMGDCAQSEPGGLERVHLRDAGLLQMRGGAELELLAAASRAAMISGRCAPSFNPSTPFVGAPATHVARRFRRIDRAFVPARARSLEVDDSRRDDLVAIAALALFERQRVIGQGHADDRRDAVREPQLVRILGVGILRRFAGVLVQADESRQHVHAGGVDLEIGVLRLTAVRSATPGVPALRTAGSGCSR